MPGGPRVSTPNPTPQEPLADGVLSVVEACELARVSRSQLYRYLGSGELPSLHLGRRRLIPRRSLLAFLASRLEGAA